LPPIAATLNKELKSDAPGGISAPGDFVFRRSGARERSRRMKRGGAAACRSPFISPPCSPSSPTGASSKPDAIADVIARFPALAPRLRDESGNPYPFVTFYVNDEDIRFQGGFSAPLSDGDELTIVPAIAGG
jgi:molybdopterin converting factor small subunit